MEKKEKYVYLGKSEILSFFDLTEAEQESEIKINSHNIEEGSFIRVNGLVLRLSDFTKTKGRFYNAVFATTAFTSYVIFIDETCETIKVWFSLSLR